MFKNPTNLGCKRTGLEVFGFYIFYFILAILICGLLAQIGVLISKQNNLIMTARIDGIVAAISVLILAFFADTLLELIPATIVNTKNRSLTYFRKGGEIW